MTEEFINLDATTTTDYFLIKKYCSRCKKVCGHWSSEHEFVFNPNQENGKRI